MNWNVSTMSEYYRQNNIFLEEAMEMTNAQRISDNTLWHEYTTLKLQPLALLDEKISKLHLLLDDRFEERGSAIVVPPISYHVMLKPLHFNAINELPWFTYSNVRYVYKMLISSYLPVVENKKIIDFKVAIENKQLENHLNTEECPQELCNYMGTWINFLNTNDDRLRNIDEHSSGKIIRRGLCFGFHTILYEDRMRQVEKEMGHQIFILLDKWPSKPRHINLYIIDNIPKNYYKYNVRGMIIKCIQTKMSEIMPQFTIVPIPNIPNILPFSDNMGSCMSLSFRAMIYSSFLYNPFKKIMNIDNENQENERIFKLMYLQMERMRYSILMNPLLWDPSKPRHLYYFHKEPISDGVFDIHNINTTKFVIVPYTIIQNFYDRGKIQDLIQNLRINPDIMKEYKVSFDIDIDHDIEICVRSKIEDQVCRQMANFSQLTLSDL